MFKLCNNPMTKSETTLSKLRAESNSTQECKELMSYLPKDRAFFTEHLYQYQGFWYPPNLLEGVLYSQKHFQARDSDIVLVSSPKSGTTWLKALAFALVPKSSRITSSLWHFMKRLILKEMVGCAMEEMVRGFCRGSSVYGPFWDHALEYWKESQENPERVLFVMYEEMSEKPEEWVMKIAEFLGCSLTEREVEDGVLEDIVKLCSLENLSTLEVNVKGKLVNGMENKAFFRKGEIGGWKDTLTPLLAEEIDKATEEKLLGSAFRFFC